METSLIRADLQIANLLRLRTVLIFRKKFSFQTVSQILWKCQFSLTRSVTGNQIRDYSLVTGINASPLPCDGENSCQALSNHNEQRFMQHKYLQQNQMIINNAFEILKLCLVSFDNKKCQVFTVIPAIGHWLMLGVLMTEPQGEDDV